MNRGLAVAFYSEYSTSTCTPYIQVCALGVLSHTTAVVATTGTVDTGGATTQIQTNH